MIRIEAGIQETVDGKQAYLPYAIIAKGWEDMTPEERIEVKAELAKRQEMRT